MQVKGRHAQADLLPGKNAIMNCKDCVGPRKGLDVFEYEKISYSN